MLLLIPCRYLEVADRRMTTAITLILAQAFVAGSTSLVYQLMRNRVLYRRPFPERGPSTLRLHLSSQLLLERLVLADAQASALSVGGCGALGSQGTRVTRRRRKLGLLAGDDGDGLATRTGYLHTRKVQGEIMLREKRTNLRPGASDNVHALRGPLGNPWAGHVSQINIELQQAGGFLQLLGQQLYRLMLRLIRRADHHLPGDFAIQIHGKVFLEAVEGFGAAFAAVAHVFILDRDAPVRRDVLLDTSPARSTLRVWLGVLRDNLCEGIHDLLQRRCLGRQGLLLRQPALPLFHLLQDQAQRALPRAGLPPIQVQCGFETAVSYQRQPCILHDCLSGCAQCRSHQVHRLAQRMAEQVQRVLDPAGTEQGCRVQDHAQLPGTEAPGVLRQCDGPIQQGLVHVVGDEPHPEVQQGALTEGGMLGTEAVQDHLPALVHHGQLDGVPVADVTVGLQERGEGQQSHFHRLAASRLRARAVGQRVLKVCVEELMAALAQKHKKLPRLAGACGYFLLFRGQRDGRVPHNGLLTVEGSRCSCTYQSTDMPLLSTPYEPLSKQLISVLDVHFVNPLPVSLRSATVYNGSHAQVVVDSSLRLIRSWTMPAPLAPPGTLARDAPSRLEAIARAPSTPQAVAFRCQVILRAAAPEHASTLQGAQELPCHRQTVGRWRRRSLAQGLGGLQDAPRPGRPRRFPPLSPA